MTFLEFAAPPLTKLIQTLATKSLTQALEGVRRERQMKRLIEDAVDRVVEQAEGYLRSEKLAREKQELLLTAIFTQLQPFVDEPARLFRAGLDGQRIFEQAHASGQLPEEIREEGHEQFYSVLFPHVAQLVAGSAPRSSGLASGELSRRVSAAESARGRHPPGSALSRAKPSNYGAVRSIASSPASSLAQ